MRPGTSEYAVQVEFEFGLQARAPLSSPTKLGKKGFPIPVTFLYGKLDWTVKCDGDAYKTIFEANKDPSKCKMYWVPDADHNMHMDNPRAQANLIFNDIFGTNLPILNAD